MKVWRINCIHPTPDYYNSVVSVTVLAIPRMQLQPTAKVGTREHIIPLLAVHKAEKTREISLEILWRSFLLSRPAPATLGFDNVSHSRPSYCWDFIFIRTDIVLLFEDKVYFFIVAAHYTLLNISHIALGDLSIQGWESLSLATSVLCFMKQTDRTFTDWINVCTSSFRWLYDTWQTSLGIQPSPVGRMRFETQRPDGRRLYPQATGKLIDSFLQWGCRLIW